MSRPEIANHQLVRFCTALGVCSTFSLRANKSSQKPSRTLVGYLCCGRRHRRQSWRSWLFIFFPAPQPFPPVPNPNPHRTPGLPPATARRRSTPSVRRFWRDAGCNQRPIAPPATRGPQPGNNRLVPEKNFHAGNSARRRSQKSPRPARAITRAPWPRHFVAIDVADS